MSLTRPATEPTILDEDLKADLDFYMSEAMRSDDDDAGVDAESRNGFFKNAFKAYRAGKQQYREGRLNDKRKKLAKLQDSIERDELKTAPRQGMRTEGHEGAHDPSGIVERVRERYNALKRSDRATSEGAGTAAYRAELDRLRQMLARGEQDTMEPRARNDDTGLSMRPAGQKSRQSVERQWSTVMQKPQSAMAAPSSSLVLFDSPALMSTLPESIRRLLSVFRSPPMDIYHVNGTTWGDAASQVFHVLLDSQKISAVVEHNARKMRESVARVSLMEQYMPRTDDAIAINGRVMKSSQACSAIFAVNACHAATYAAMFDSAVPVTRIAEKGMVDIDISRVPGLRADDFCPREVSLAMSVPSSAALQSITRDTAFVSLVKNTKTGRFALWGLHYNFKTRSIDGLMIADDVVC